MSGEVFRRVGRGGAGNWYSKRDVDDANKLDDVEAQRPKAPSPQPADLADSRAAPPSSSYARAGRGGAGNFYAADSVAVSTAERQHESARLQAAVNHTTTTTTATTQHRPMALSGRGGAGNWVSGGTTTASADEERKQAELEARIRQDVEAGLPMPPPAYHGAAARDGKEGLQAVG